MQLSIDDADGALIVHLSGRVDAYTSQELEEKLRAWVDTGHYRLVLDFGSVDYLSSAGIRVLLSLEKKVSERNGGIKLACVQPYPMDVLKISGLANYFSVYHTVSQAAASFPGVRQIEDTTPLETHETPIGVFKFARGEQRPSELRVLGSNLDFLYARCTEESIVSEPLSRTKYSLGIGALGEKADDYINRLGELMTVGGTVVWVPTDGRGIPDYLIPMEESEQVKIHTAFNLVLDGVFNETVRFEVADQDKGASIRSIYQHLFECIRKRTEDFMGVLGLVMRANVGCILGAGIKQSPTAANAPKNGELITHRDNIKEWLDFQVEPEHQGTSALVVGVGLAPGSTFEASQLQSIFHIPHKTVKTRFPIARHRQRAGEVSEIALHNHAAIFGFLPEAHSGYQIESEVAHMIQNGQFVGMEHLLDSSTFKEGILGLSYVQNIRQE